MQTQSTHEGAVTYDGGDERDQAALLALHHKFLVVNDALDSERLRDVWSDNPDNIYFNTNGHTYRGLADWFKIWDHYRPRFEVIGGYRPGDVRIMIRGDLGVIIAENVQRFKRWVGDEQPHNPSKTRITMVCERLDGTWMAVHCHFSVQEDGLRPDQQQA